GEHEAAGGAPGRVPAKPLELPGGLPVSIEMTSALNPESAAGDRIQGRLAKAVIDPAKHTVLLPEGAALEGRLMRVEVHHPKPTEFTLTLRWETIELDGAKRTIVLLPNRKVNIKEATRGLLRPRGVEIELPLPGEERYQVYHFPGNRVV